MKFLIDAQLPPALCQWLRERGHEAEHVFEVGLVAASDIEIAARAEADGEVLVSKDEDFALTAWLEVRWERIEALMLEGERFVEVR